MNIDSNEIERAVDKAREITIHYLDFCLRGDVDMKSINELLRLSTEYLKKDVKIYELNEVPASAPEDRSKWAIRGIYTRSKDDVYRIYVYPGLEKCDNGLNTCEARFVRCKELFHVMLDEEKYRTTNIYNLLEKIDNPDFIGNDSSQYAVYSEAMAEIAAMEFLFPYERRIHECKKEGEPDYLAIAKHYKVPQYLIERYLKPGLMELLGTVHRKTNLKAVSQ